MTLHKWVSTDASTPVLLNGNNNSLLNYNATSKINNLKTTLSSNQVITSDNSNTLLFSTSSDLQTSTYNTSSLWANDGYAWYDDTHDIIYSGVIYDNYSNGSVDATLWTTAGGGSVTETANTKIGNSLTSTSAITLTTDSTGASGIELKPVGTNTEFFVKVRCASESTSSVLQEGILKIRDGSANEADLHVLFSGTNSLPHDVTSILRVVLTATQAIVYTDRDTSSTVDISGLVGTDWFVRVYSNRGTSGANRNVVSEIFPLVYVNQSTISSSTIESVRTASNDNITVDTGFISGDDMGDGLGTSTIGISADNGSNFTTVTHKELETITNTGSTVSVKWTLQGTSREKLIKLDSQCLMYGGA